ncbi:CBM35 domain-containing protein [Streptomyces sp. WI04-05B]|uniref:CBM35 domain-containing protein n=1 Tax=Streptomyces TaxID=1883 RepID=UPI0029A683D2|nr:MULTISPECIES: CBM35 domain-containing protein [unclassified Streptomyces]MDX2544933.1 CBM35 domain-containing protein [Streptomyces sp. WI04-05B]MDX2588981.1 CBM35 domain-containing protein [Streptomyces sp. WI04-05A]
MTPGNSGASTPEDDDPFGYLYEDGRANGAQPPSSGYGYPNSVGRTRPVGERQYSGPPQGQQQSTYGQSVPTAQTAQYGQTIPQQQGAYGAPNAHYQAPEAFGGGPAAPQQQSYSGGNGRGGRGSGPNTKGLLIGAIAVVAAVVIGIAVAMMGGDGDKGTEADPTPTTGQSAEPSPSASASKATEGELPAVDAKALLLGGGAATTSDVDGAKAAGGVYVGNFNNVGASVTWNVSGIAKSGKYTLYTGYSVPGKDATATLTVNGTASDTPVGMDNYGKVAEGDYEKGWTRTYNYVQLNKGTNTIKISCEQGNQCDALIDQLWLVNGWVDS